MNPVDEKIIIKKLKAGDNEAYKYLYDYHYVALCKLSYYMLKDKIQAESIVSDVIFHLWEIRENLELVPPLRNYLIIAVRNKCLNYLKHIQVEVEYSKKRTELHDWEITTRIQTLENESYSTIFSKDIMRIVMESLSELPEHTRHIFVLNRLDYKSRKEIATTLGVSQQKVDYHINKANDHLRLKLKDYIPLILLFLN